MKRDVGIHFVREIVAVKARFAVPLLAILLLQANPLVHGQVPSLPTKVEESNYQATSRHADVVAFCERLAKVSPLVRVAELGKTHEGRPLPLVIMADPPISKPEDASTSKLTVLLIGNIHAGEVDGKEALLMLMRDLAAAKERPWLKDLTLLWVPIFNADGNERIARTNRTWQPGPADGVGERTNAQGMDLNRDFVKLETPEVRALVRCLNQWNPGLVIDTHTTNGSYHRYKLTYDGPLNPACHEPLVTLARDKMLPAAAQQLEKATGFKSFFYGNYSKDRSRWETYPAQLRYGIQYIAARQRIALLSESYAYASYKDRITASKEFVRACLDYAAKERSNLNQALRAARDANRQAKVGESVTVRHKLIPQKEPVTILGVVEEMKDGRRVPTEQPQDVKVAWVNRPEAVVAVPRPYAYLIPKSYAKAVENLQRHGIEIEELREDLEMDVEAYRLEKIQRAERAFQNHTMVLNVEATPRKESRMVPAGTLLVKTAQPLGNLAVCLLEPQSDDGLTTWNFFDEGLKDAQDHPVLRVPAAVPVISTPARPLPEDRKPTQPVAAPPTGRRFGGGGGGAGISAWLDDGEHYIQTRGERQYKVHARTGRAEPWSGADATKVAKALAALPTVGKEAAQGLARQALAGRDPKRTGALLTHQGDLYYVALDGSKAVRLTKSPGTKELSSLSPDGQFAVFVRGNNLFAVDVATQTERALTNDGSDVIFNGKADWVYFEEIFNRNHKAYWWSPDSRYLAFLRFDDKPVHKFTVTDMIPVRQRLEETPYPKAGDPNPLAKLGLVSLTGGDVQWVDTKNYPEDKTLLIRASWTPDSQSVYCYVTDRAQTWLDVVSAGPQGGTPVRLFRETTKAWVDDPGDPLFLKDGSFLFQSERSGWKQLYHYGRDGKLIRPVTQGDWELDRVLQVDEAGGWVYFSAKKDSPIADNLYRVRLSGGAVERLSQGSGDHRPMLSPKANLVVDTWSDHQTPPKVRLLEADGKPVRWLDTNPSYDQEQSTASKPELVHIKTPDGFVLEGILVKPKGFDPKKKYPVWFQTYAGPHAPRVRDSWGAGRGQDQAMANLGFIMFTADPRSASGKGAVSTWSAYRQLGVQEMKDIEVLIGWLKEHPWVDGDRIGMSGTSYGGFMTAYAMTHSKLFAAGIAGAPVTDWKNYDSIYTERYMDTPQNNKEGYEKTSVVKAAANLHGRLLLVHGLMDDNVHPQNSVQLMQALQQANKDFEVMFYPRARHGGFGQHYNRMTVDFMKRTLKPTPAGE